MKALLIIDVQKGFLDENDYDPSYEVVDSVVKLATKFKENDDKVIALKHSDEDADSVVASAGGGADIPKAVLEVTDDVIEKRYAISFKGTNLDDVLKENDINELFITGFNMESCILFTSVAAADRGYDVTVVKDLCISSDTYHTENFNIVDFIGSVFDRSGLIKIKYLDDTEFMIKK